MAAACPSCGAPSVEGDRFCNRCGSALGGEQAGAVLGSRFCTRCGNRLEAEDGFCGSCGAEVLVRAGVDEATEAVPALIVEEDDLFTDWDMPEVSPDSAPTETIAVRSAQTSHSDTAVLPRPAEPYRTPGATAEPTEPSPEAPSAPSQGFPLGATFALVGGVAVIVSSVLEWLGPFQADVPRDIPILLLVDPAGTASGPSLGIVLLAIGTLGALMALLTMAAPYLKFVRRLIGLATLAIPVVFAMRTAAGLTEITRLPDRLGVGVYVAAAGAIVQMVAGRWFRRGSSERRSRGKGV